MEGSGRGLREECSKHWRKGRKNSLGRRERSKPYKGQLARVGWVGRGQKAEERLSLLSCLCPQLSTQLCPSMPPFFPHPLCFHSAPAYRELTLPGSWLGVNGDRDIPFPGLLGMAAVGEVERCKMRRFRCSGAVWWSCPGGSDGSVEHEGCREGCARMERTFMMVQKSKAASWTDVKRSSPLAVL